MDLELIKQHNEEQAKSAEERAKIEDTALALNEILKSQQSIENSVRESILSLVKFIKGNKPEVSVTNQQPFPKYDEVVKAVKEVVTEVKNSNKALKTVEQKETDLSPITKSLEKLSQLVSKLPTAIPVTKSVEVSNQKDYTGKFDEVTQAVGKIPAPIVNVEKPVIPDNSKELEKLLKAVEKIKFPEIPKTDLKPLIEATKKVSQTVSSMSFPVPNYVLPFKQDGKATQVILDSSGNVPVTATDLDIRNLTFATDKVDASGSSVSVSSSALPSGAATEATLASIKDTAGIKKITDALPAGTNLIGAEVPSASASVGTGTSHFRDPAVTNTAVAIKATAGKLHGYNLYNPNASLVFVHFYNATAASVTVGTTTPLRSVALPSTANGTIALESNLPIGIAFSTAISVAVSTTATGGVAPGTACVVNVEWI